MRATFNVNAADAYEQFYGNLARSQRTTGTYEYLRIFSNNRNTEKCWESPKYEE